MRKGGIYGICGIVILLQCAVILPIKSYATKPCPNHPCRDSSGKLLEQECHAAADWVAVGTIGQVVHDLKGHPLNKDFAIFVFRPKYWEKGAQTKLSEIRYKVGWCHNRTEVPKDRAGTFRFYGLSRTGSSSENLYLDFVRIE